PSPSEQQPGGGDARAQFPLATRGFAKDQRRPGLLGPPCRRKKPRQATRMACSPGEGGDCLIQVKEEKARPDRLVLPAVGGPSEGLLHHDRHGCCRAVTPAVRTEIGRASCR